MSTTESNCVCGKNRTGLNLTNWNRHLSFCKVAKLKNNKICSDFTSFFQPKHGIASQGSSIIKKCIILFFICDTFYPYLVKADIIGQMSNLTEESDSVEIVEEFKYL